MKSIFTILILLLHASRALIAAEVWSETAFQEHRSHDKAIITGIPRQLFRFMDEHSIARAS